MMRNLRATASESWCLRVMIRPPARPPPQPSTPSNDAPPNAYSPSSSWTEPRAPRPHRDRARRRPSNVNEMTWFITARRIQSGLRIFRPTQPFLTSSNNRATAARQAASPTPPRSWRRSSGRRRRPRGGTSRRPTHPPPRPPFLLPSRSQRGATWQNPNHGSRTAREGQARSICTPASGCGSAESCWE